MGNHVVYPRPPRELSPEAIEDGIELIDNYFAVPCEICGGIIYKTQYSRKRQYICEKCKKKIKAMRDVDVTILTTTQKNMDEHEERFAKAIEAIKDQASDFDEYKTAIKLASSRLVKYGSIPEAMGAIELLKHKQKIIPQQRVGSYTVDFCLPDLKLVIEVDGRFYHRNRDKDYHRDCCLRRDLGYDWTIAHVSAEKVRRDVTHIMSPIWRLQETIIPN